MFYVNTSNATPLSQILDRRKPISLDAQVGDRPTVVSPFLNPFPRRVAPSGETAVGRSSTVNDRTLAYSLDSTIRYISPSFKPNGNAVRKFYRYLSRKTVGCPDIVAPRSLSLAQHFAPHKQLRRARSAPSVTPPSASRTPFSSVRWGVSAFP